MAEEAVIPDMVSGLSGDQKRVVFNAMPPDDLVLFTEVVLAKRAQGDDVGAVAAFGQLVFGKRPAAIHRDWIAEVLGHLRGAASAPPASAKTTWITTITMAWWIGKHPLTSNGICSAGDDVADDMTKAIADTIEFNPQWRKVFPHVVPDKQRGWSSDGYHVRDDSVDPAEWARLRYGTKNPSLVGGGVGSARWNGLRITGMFVLDDIHDRKSKTQQKTCDDTVGFFKDTGEYRVTPEAHLFIVQTRWNPKDIIAHVKGRKDFRVFEHPAILTDEDGAERSYWPEERPLEHLRDIRGRSPIDFELVFQGNDQAVAGAVLKAEWLHSFPHLEIKREWNRYFGIDPAKRVKEVFSRDDDPDSFRIAVLVDTGSRLVIEDILGDVLFQPDAEELFFAQAAIWKPKVTGIESNGLGNEYYVNFLKRMRAQGLAYVVMPIHTSTDMGERMSDLSPYLKSGQILVSDLDTPGLQAFRAEWLMFPRGHDDTLSAVHLAWRVAGHLLPVSGTPAGAAKKSEVASPAEAIRRAYGL